MKIGPKTKRFGVVVLVMYAAAFFMYVTWCGCSFALLLQELLISPILFFAEPLFTVLGIGHFVRGIMYDNANIYKEGVGTVLGNAILVLSYVSYIALALCYVFVKRRWLARVCLAVLVALIGFASYFATVMDPRM